MGAELGPFLAPPCKKTQPTARLRHPCRAGLGPGGGSASAQPARAQGRSTVVWRMPELAPVCSGLGVLRLAWSPSLYHQLAREGSRLQLAEMWAIGAGRSAMGRVVQHAEATALLVVDTAGALERVPCTVWAVALQPFSCTPVLDPGHLGPPAGGPGGTSFPGELRLAEVG